MKKDYTISALRIFSMTFIVLCHVINFYPFIPGYQHLSEVFNVGVQVFLLISGFLYGNKTVGNYKKWYFGRIKKLVVPVSLIAAIDIIILYCMGHKTDVVTVFAYLFNLQGLLFLNWSFFSKFITEITNLGPLWFATIIMLCYLLIPVLQKVRGKYMDKSKNKKYTSIILAGGGIYLLTILINMTGIIALGYFAVFITGYLAAVLEFKASSTNFKTVVLFSFATIIIQVFRIIIRSKLSHGAVYSAYVSISHAVLGFWIFYMFFWLSKVLPSFFNRIMSTKAMNYLDKKSYYIYLVHGLFCMGGVNTFNVYGTDMNLVFKTVIFIAATIISAEILSLLTDGLNRLIDKLQKNQRKM